MKFRLYDNIDAYSSDVLGVLLENEIENNIIISLITENKAQYNPGWMLATVTGAGEGVILAALCVPPLNLLLSEPSSAPQQDALELLSQKIRQSGYKLPGITAKSGLARRFSEIYTAPGMSRLQMKLSLMRLDKLDEYEKAPGYSRFLDDRDMSFVPYWEHAFSEDCGAHTFSIPENIERIKTRLGMGTHMIWEDGAPVSQAVHGRNTPNGAVINWVYTPPTYRGRGYATSVVAELSGSLLSRGKRFCCLFADIGNPISCKLYHNLGYYDFCEFADIRFDI